MRIIDKEILEFVDMDLEIRKMLLNPMICRIFVGTYNFVIQAKSAKGITIERLRIMYSKNYSYVYSILENFVLFGLLAKRKGHTHRATFYEPINLPLWADYMNQIMEGKIKGKGDEQ